MPEKSTTIRPLNEDDFAAWWKLRLIALRDHPDAFGSGYEETVAAGEATARQRFIGGGTNRIFGAFAGEALVGVCGIVGNERAKTRHRMDIWGMYVSPPFRGTGAGTRLLQAAIEYARGVAGVLQIHLTVASHNIAAITTYSRLGFTSYGREPRALRLPNRFVDEDMMVLMLDTPAPK